MVCFVMSMHNGFESEIRSRLLGTTSHISIFPFGPEPISNYKEIIEKTNAVPGVIATSPFIFYKAAISSASAGDGIIVRGIDLDLENQTAKIKDVITAGSYSFAPTIREDDTLPGMMMGNTLAERLGVSVGDPIVLYSLKGEDLHGTSRPRVAKFAISGLFETGMFEFDAEMAYISLSDAQKLFRMGDAVTALHLKLTDMYQSENMTPVIDSILEHRFDIVPWNVLHKNLFAWIALEKKMLFLGFILIVLVAAFSIISTLVMLAMEKRPEVGILKTMGATPNSIRRIFIYKGLVIGCIGVVTGWILALAATIIQNQYEIISLPADIYFISYLPVETHLMDFLLSGVVTVAICYLASLYPAYRAARLSVIEVLRQ